LLGKKGYVVVVVVVVGEIYTWTYKHLGLRLLSPGGHPLKLEGLPLLADLLLLISIRTHTKPTPKEQFHIFWCMPYFFQKTVTIGQYN